MAKDINNTTSIDANISTPVFDIPDLNVDKINLHIFGGIIDDIILATLIFVIFQIIRIFITRIVFKIIDEATQKTKNKFDDEIIKVIKKPISFLFILLGIRFGSEALPLNDTFEKVFYEILDTAFAVLIFWTIFKFIKPFSKVIQGYTARYGKELSDDITNILTRTAQFLVFAIGFVAIMKNWGYDITGFLASLGLVGMAFALAAKDTAANLFGSIVIFTDKPFKVGDWIETPDVEGFVEEIGIRSSRVRTFAMGLVTVPNDTLANSPIQNWTQMNKRRVSMKIGVTYSTKSSQILKIVNEIRDLLENHEGVNQEFMNIGFTDYLDSSLGITVYYFTNTTAWIEHTKIKEDINVKIMQIVEENGSSFAFPSRSLYFENEINAKINYNEIDKVHNDINELKKFKLNEQNSYKKQKQIRDNDKSEKTEKANDPKDVYEEHDGDDGDGK